MWSTPTGGNIIVTVTLIQDDGGTRHSSFPTDQDIPCTDSDSSITYQDRPSEDQGTTTIVHQDTTDEDKIESLPPIPRVSQVPSGLLGHTRTHHITISLTGCDEPGQKGCTEGNSTVR